MSTNTTEAPLTQASPVMPAPATLNAEAPRRMSFLLPFATLKAASLCASRDESRYPICGVCVEWIEPRRVLLVSTDSRRLLAIEVTPDVSSGWTEPTTLTLPNALLDAFFTAVGSTRIFLPVTVTIRRDDRRPLRRIGLELPDLPAMEMLEIDGQFPRWRKPEVVPAGELMLSSAPIAPKYLADLLAVGSFLGKPSNALRWYSANGAHRHEKGTPLPQVIAMGLPNVLAIIMPVELEVTAPPAIPEWAREGEDPQAIAARAERRERVAVVIEVELACKAEAITDEARLIEDLGGDSLELAEVLMALEVEFDISIDSEEWKDWTTVGDVVEMVERRVGGAK